VPIGREGKTSGTSQKNVAKHTTIKVNINLIAISEGSSMARMEKSEKGLKAQIKKNTETKGKTRNRDGPSEVSNCKGNEKGGNGGVETNDAREKPQGKTSTFTTIARALHLVEDQTKSGERKVSENRARSGSL